MRSSIVKSASLLQLGRSGAGQAFRQRDAGASTISRVAEDTEKISESDDPGCTNVVEAGMLVPDDMDNWFTYARSLPCSATQPMGNLKACECPRSACFTASSLPNQAVQLLHRRSCSAPRLLRCRELGVRPHKPCSKSSVSASVVFQNQDVAACSWACPRRCGTALPRSAPCCCAARSVRIRCSLPR